MCAGVLRGPQKSRKRRQFEPLPNQLLKDNIDDVGNIFKRTRGIPACCLHCSLGIFSPCLDGSVIPN